MTKQEKWIFTALMIFFLILLNACQQKKTNQGIYLGQGIMSGEVTKNSVILQARLTKSDTLINGDLPGTDGIGFFEISTTLDFKDALETEVLSANYENDFILKTKVTGLEAGRKYHYRLKYGPSDDELIKSKTGRFYTLQGAGGEKDVSFIVVTGMNYARHFYGRSDGHRKSWSGYNGLDRELGFPALKTILDMDPAFFVATGDNIYYDRNYPGQKNAETQDELRQRWHEQFVRPRFHDLFLKIPSYWEKDDHDHRYDDSDPYSPERLPGHKLGVKTFLEQVPVVDPTEVNPITYRTYRINKHVQVWFTEGRDYRSPNRASDGPEKTMWGEEQKEWLKSTLLRSDASIKFLISPTSLVGPDDWGNKRDSHLNAFRHERKAFFDWLVQNDFQNKNFYILCGDRHWQYHALDPTGIEEFSCGALVDGNSRLGVTAGDPNSTDPQGKIKQLYLQPEASGGFLRVFVKSLYETPAIIFTFYDENGQVLYNNTKYLK
jgi:alkaline phosphatase D